MSFLVLGFVLLGAVGGLLYWLAYADPEDVRRAFLYIAVALLTLLALYLALTGKLGVMMAALFAAFPFFLKAMRWGNMVRQILSLFGMARSAAQGGYAASGQSSDIETDWLAMSLDHETGQIEGGVKQGQFAGASLVDLSPHQLLTLWSELMQDEDSRQVLEAYLDRRSDCENWRDDVATQQGQGSESQQQSSPGFGAMDLEEARRILGVTASTPPDEIKKAYQRLMQAVHPDHGGSDYLAAKINQARERLLGDDV